MEKDGLLEQYIKYTEDPESIPSDAYAQSLVTRVIRKYGSIENAQELVNIEKKKRTSLENKFNFIKTADEMHLNPDELLENRADKENLILKYGYPNDPNKRDLLAKYSDEKLGEFYKKIYYSIKGELPK
ncbi:MAG: hypothetical protein ACP5NZ_02965 [Nanobdellota archaeon]